MDKNRVMVLIVDDQPTNLKVLFSFLQNQNFEVRVLESGEQTVEMLKHTLPDIILIDVMMPGMDGFITCRKIKENKRTAGIPIIFLSALNDTEDKAAGFEAGGIDYITKPFKKVEVLARLNSHLSQQKKQRELELALAEIKTLSETLERRVEERTVKLKESNEQLKQKKEEIEKNSIALKVLLDQYQVTREEIENEMSARLKKLVYPYLTLLQQDTTDEQKEEYLSLIKAHLDIIMASFSKRLDNPTWRLTPREILVADLVKQGKNTKEIGKLLKISFRTAERHRNNIRKKIGLTNKKLSLHAYLCSALSRK